MMRLAVWYESGIFFSSVALVIVTSGLVWVTARMAAATSATAAATNALVASTNALVCETERARLAAVLPVLAINIDWWGEYAFVVLHNVGPGAALDVDVQLEFVADQKEEVYGDAFRLWRTNVMPSGVRHRFSPPRNSSGQSMTADELAHVVNTITLSGTVKDSLGMEHRVSNVIPAFRALLASEKLSERQLEGFDPIERISRHLKEVNDHLANLVGTAERLGFAVEATLEK